VGRTIEVYVMNKEVVTQTVIEGRPLAAGDTVHYCTVKEIAKTEKILSEKDREALQLVQTIATQRKYKVQIIDLASLKGKMKARLKGVRTTPTIIVGGNRIEGVPKKEQLEEILA
jgi:protein-disulfide isomerase